MDARATITTTRRIALDAVMESYARLRARYDCVVVEGAGSPAEINLRERDIANMGFAEAVDCPGDAGRRHRPRRRVRPSRAARWTAFRRQRTRRVHGLRHQPFSRRSSRCCSRDWTGWSSAPASRCSACCRTCTACTSKPRTPLRPSRPPPSPARAACGWPCRCCRASATTPISTRCARIREVDVTVRRPRRGDRRPRPDRPARLARTCRPTWTGCARRAGSRDPARTCATAAS